MKKFEITQEQIIELSKVSLNAKEVFRNWFPEAFEKPLEVGKWYKLERFGELLVCITDIENNLAYGFDFYGRYLNETTFGFDSLVEATSQEVEASLIAEAKKRGFVKGIFINDLYLGENSVIISSNDFDYETIKAGKQVGEMALRDSNGNILFHNGQWATIFNTITKEEAEKLLNKKIV